MDRQRPGSAPRRRSATLAGTSALLLLLSLQLCPGRQENERLLLTDATEAKQMSLVDKRGGATWDLGVVQSPRLSADGRSVVLSADLAGTNPVRLLERALAIEPADGGYALVPAREGLLVPADGPVEFTHQFPSSAYEGCHLNMLGFVKCGAALLVTWDDVNIAPSLTKKKSGLTCTINVRRPPQSNQTATTLTLTPLGKGDWNTVSAAYRELAQAKGFAVTLREKARRNPEAEKLAGAANAKLWMCLARRRNEASTADESVVVHWTFDEAAKVAEHLKNDLGLQRCLFTLGGWTEGGYDCRHPDALPANAECGGNSALADAVRRIRALGYVACFHDNYQDMYRDAKAWDPDFIQKKPDGSLVQGGRWQGGRAYLVCAPKALELAQRPQNLPAVQKLFAPQAYFIDTTYAVDPQQCFDPKHPLTRADDIRWKQALSDYTRGVFGLFGSECGREWAIPHSDFFEGLSGVSGKYFHNLDPATLGATVIPLFEMVYHDCESVFGKYPYRPEGAAEYVAHHVLCARTLNYHSFPDHLYWQAAPGAPDAARNVEVQARPSISSAEVIGPRKLRLKYRWQVDADCAGTWRVFVHFGARDPVPLQNDHAPARAVATWRAGEVIEEGPFDVTIPDTVAPDALDILIGLCRGPDGAERAWLPHCDAKGRVLAGRLRLKPTIAFEKVDGPLPLLGDPGCFTRADHGWAAGLCVTDRFIKNTHEVLSPLAELTAHARLVQFEFLSADRAVRRATYRDDTGKLVAVTVNFGQASYTVRSKLGQSVSLPTWGFLVEAPTFVAFHATSWAGRSYQQPVLFTIRLGGAQAHIFHAFGDAQLMWQGQSLEVPRETAVAYAAGAFPTDAQ